MKLNLTLLGSLCLLLWVTLGFVRPWFGPPSYIARAERSGSIEVLTWAPPWNRDIVEHIELYGVNKTGASPELIAKAQYLNDNHDGRFWLILSDRDYAGEQYYILAHLRNGKVAPKQDVTKVLTNWETFQQPYFVYSMPLFLLGVALIVAGQSVRGPSPAAPPAPR